MDDIIAVYKGTKIKFNGYLGIYMCDIGSTYYVSANINWIKQKIDKESV